MFRAELLPTTEGKVRKEPLETGHGWIWLSPGSMLVTLCCGMVWAVLPPIRKGNVGKEPQKTGQGWTTIICYTVITGVWLGVIRVWLSNPKFSPTICCL